MGRDSRLAGRVRLRRPLRRGARLPRRQRRLHRGTFRRAKPLRLHPRRNCCAPRRVRRRLTASHLPRTATRTCASKTRHVAPPTRKVAQSTRHVASKTRKVASATRRVAQRRARARQPRAALAPLTRRVASPAHSGSCVVQTKVPHPMCGFCAANRVFVPHNVKFAALAPLTFGLIFGIIPTLVL